MLSTLAHSVRRVAVSRAVTRSFATAATATTSSSTSSFSGTFVSSEGEELSPAKEKEWEWRRRENRYRAFGYIAGGITLAAGIAILDGQTASATEKEGQVDYAAVRRDLEEIMDNSDYEDGSYGPILVRLAWHCAGTYNRATGTGGSNGATMRFKPESDWGANAGLGIARDLLEKVKAKHPGISYADLYTLAGTVAIRSLGGPDIPWRPGRSDAPSSRVKTQAPDGTLPDASKKSDHLRAIFYRMGLTDRDIVALSGAHTLGRCHTDRSGYDGPWSFSPTTFSNSYFTLLVEEQWVKRDWDGPLQYTDEKTKSLMMLPSDLALLEDPVFSKYVKVYAKDEAAFFADFSDAWRRLMELGCF